MQSAVAFAQADGRTPTAQNPSLGYPGFRCARFETGRRGGPAGFCLQGSAGCGCVITGMRQAFPSEGCDRPAYEAGQTDRTTSKVNWRRDEEEALTRRTPRPVATNSAATWDRSALRAAKGKPLGRFGTPAIRQFSKRHSPGEQTIKLVPLHLDSSLVCSLRELIECPSKPRTRRSYPSIAIAYHIRRCIRSWTSRISAASSLTTTLIT